MPCSTDAAALARADVVLVRHGETTYNEHNLLSGDPAVRVELSPAGRAQCRALAPLLAPIPWASLYITRFVRTAESAALLLPDGGPPPQVEPDLDDIDVGQFEGRPRDEYRDWRRHHGVAEAPRGGESRLDVIDRYARALRRLALEAPRPALVVTHDQPIRYLENVLRDEDPVFGSVGPIPNAVPYPYAAEELVRGADRLAAYDTRRAANRAASADE